MRKVICTCIAALLMVAVSAQTVDSTEYRQVDSLIQISRTLTKQRMFDKALEANVNAESIALKTFGAESEAYGTCCFDRGSIMYQKREFEEAKAWFLKSKEIREIVLGRAHPDYAYCLYMLAIIYKIEGKYELAEEFHLETKKLFEQALGKNHPAYAGNLEYLANLYTELGYYEKAEPLFIEAKTIKENSIGVMTIPYALSLRKIAIFYSVSGKYEKAELAFLEAKSIIQSISGIESADYSGIENSLANLYTLMGNYERAESLYLEAKTIREKVYGREHPNYIGTLTNLAILYKNMGQYNEAEQLFIEARNIAESSTGNDDSNYAVILHNLANLYLLTGNYEEAEKLCLKVNALWLEAFGNEHPEYAQSLYVMANLYSQMGNYEKAESLLSESIAIIERAFGKQHPEYGHGINDLALMYEQQYRYEESTPLIMEALEVDQLRMSEGISFLSEMELSKYIYSQQRSVSIYSLLYSRPIERRKAFQPLCYNHILFQKGFLLQAGTRLQNLAGFSAEALAISNELKGYRRRIAQELIKPISERKSLEDLEEKSNAIEKSLARTIAGYSEAIRQVKWQEVQSALGRNEAAIEFVNFSVNFPNPSDSVMYAALLITSDSPQPVFIPLFEERELINVIFRRTSSPDDQLLAQLYTRGLVPTSGQVDQEGLYDLCWKPLDILLAGIRTIYYSPSGMLNQINFDAIPIGFDAGGEGLTLTDKYALVRLGSTRSIVIPDATPVNPSNEVALYGGIHYEMDTSLLALTDSMHNEPVYTTSGFTYALRSVSDRGGDWSYLPGTAQEIAEIKRIGEHVQFPVTLYQGSTATEETVKEIGRGKASPRILHFATHGFFFPDPEIKNTGLGDAEPVFKSSDNPMIRSGLILAGGNYAWQHGQAVSVDKEDGILTAYEISQMNLSNTELVVLSACETGLGDIQGNEGVYGLQRAFKIAGAKYLIMSLWQVPDRETMEFMTTFYKNWLENNMMIPDAFRQTQREMRNRVFNPYYWAGFVLVE